MADWRMTEEDHHKLSALGRELVKHVKDMAIRENMNPYEMFGAIFATGASLIESVLEYQAKERGLTYVRPAPTEEDRAMGNILAHLELDALTNVLGCFGAQFIKRGVVELQGGSWPTAKVMLGNLGAMAMEERERGKGPIYN